MAYNIVNIKLYIIIRLNNIIGGLAEIGIWKHSGAPAALKSMKKVKQKWTYRIGRRRRRADNITKGLKSINQQ